MARDACGRLNARKAATAGPGVYGDGGGLYLCVNKSLSRSWVFRFSWEGRRPEMGLGNLDIVPLAEARAKALEARRMVAAGINPIEERRKVKARRANKRKFGDVADALIEAKAPEWRNARHRAQWEMTLREYCAPLRSRPVDEIDTEAVLAVLTPLWSRAQETATRTRGRIEAVLDAATAQGLRSGENPARWRGHLQHLLPRRQKLEKGRLAALPYTDIPGLMQKLRGDDSIASRAVEFIILTAARAGEVLGANWSEIDMGDSLWTVPATRMKAGREHRVPLCGRAIEILQEMAALRVSQIIFPGRFHGRPMAHDGLYRSLSRAGVEGATVHGFRSSFRDWCGNETHFPREVAEAALAHTIGGTEAAYRRGDALEKRRALMQAWADYIEPKEAGGAEVIVFKRSGE